MYWLSLIAVIGVGVAPAGLGDKQPLENVVAKAVKDYVPHWLPADGALKGCVVGIDPVGGGAAQPEARVWDDLSLLTAGYLYYMVDRAGGKPVLIRAGDSRLAADHTRDAAARASLVCDEKCDVCVSIRYEHSQGGAGVNIVMGMAGGPLGPGGELARYLQTALKGKIVIGRPTGKEPRSLLEVIHQGKTGIGMEMPVCEVRFGCSATNERVRLCPWELYRANARALYEGLAHYAAEKLDVSGKVPPPNVTTLTVPGEAAKLARTIWPTGRLPHDRVDWFCRMFARLGVRDRSLTHFVPSAVMEEGVAILGGTTNEPSVIEGLTEALSAVGIEKVRSEIRLLPDRQVLDGKLFGVCRVPVVRTFTGPGRNSGLQTQLLFGEPVFLLDRADGYLLLHAGDGYWGWVVEEAIRPMTADEFDRYTGYPQAALLEDIDLPGLRIPRGARLPVVESSEGARIVLLPDGKRLPIPADKLADWGPKADRAADRVRAALDLLYIPYIFAGRSPIGLDCSGLITNVAARIGDDIPARDSWQQALAGTLVATDWHRKGLRPGDLVFFIRTTGRIYHVGVAISPTHIIHAAPPAVQIGSIKRGDRLYDPRLDRDFFMAKRP